MGAISQTLTRISVRPGLAKCARPLGFIGVFLWALGAHAADEDVAVRITGATGFGVAPLYYALDHDLFKKNGINVTQFAHGLAGKDVMTTFASGAVDVAVTGAGPMGVFYGAGIPAKVVSFIAESEVTLVALRPEIKGVQDLRGKTIGSSGIGSLTEVTGRMSATLVGFDTQKDAVTKPLDAPTMLSLAKLGQLDAVIVWPPITEVMLREIPGAHRVFNASDVWRKSFKTESIFPFHGLMIRQELLDRYPQKMQRMAEILAESGEYLNAHPEETARLVVKFEKLSPEDVASAMKFDPPKFTGRLTPEIKANAMRLWDFMYRNKYMDKPVDEGIFWAGPKK